MILKHFSHHSPFVPEIYRWIPRTKGRHGNTEIQWCMFVSPINLLNKKSCGGEVWRFKAMWLHFNDPYV